jgi:hypothetical protein
MEILIGFLTLLIILAIGTIVTLKRKGVALSGINKTDVSDYEKLL